MPTQRPADPLPPPVEAPPPFVDLQLLEPAAPPRPTFVIREVPAPAPAEFIAGALSNAAGTRPYKLFIPRSGHPRPMPLVVMLHGCRQDPDDFATGTRMNDLADAAGWIVLYPGQDRRFNHLGCWNWFHQGDQQRGRGEPSLIADMTRHVMATQPVDPQRVYVAGLSAGGAMAAIMATTYPELFAAVGVHSGLPHAAAKDLASALRAMRHGPGSLAATKSGERRTVPTIVFHGDEDTTVHPCNGEELIARARWTASSETAEGASDVALAEALVEHGQVLGGHAFSRTLHRDAQGRCDAEHWVIHGAGHAWSGGSADGSFADPLGPDASREMLRFFLEHPHPERGLQEG